jgi:predicted deacylase
VEEKPVYVDMHGALYLGVVVLIVCLILWWTGAISEHLSAGMAVDPTPGWDLPVKEYRASDGVRRGWLTGAADDGPTVLLVGGVHGNEPAGADALQRLCRGLDIGRITLRRGHLIIVPGANVYGLANYVRSNGSWNPLQSDLNRNFPVSGPTEKLSQQLAALADRADWVLDFHEGWGYHRLHNGSVGSTLTSTDDPRSQAAAERAIGLVNLSIDAPDMKFFHRVDEVCDVVNTLGCYCLRKRQPYVLMETTGQDEIQPRQVRVGQVLTALDSMLRDIGVEYA